MQWHGLEWLWRLIQEPRRLWRRYLIEDLGFMPLLLKEWWMVRLDRRRCDSGEHLPR
jgi:N-acetylglucosaminyldiphosphoundecaprenol N-acetyl-beta-D-mannosaminyltransferase